MDLNTTDDAVTHRIHAIVDRVTKAKANDLYYYNQPIEELRGDAKVLVRGREMGMYASYGYLGLLNHPRINEAAKRAVDKFGTGTNGVRSSLEPYPCILNSKRRSQTSNMLKPPSRIHRVTPRT